ncbi:transporter [Pontibacter sp. 172403-2]|uniref:ZIP family metal transporter n=1 Tax=Pontibacter rufus TaxID=2791028 RepID=UPI0018B00869|nr:transporter [Pontibacter sp. 172403-2]MBF9252225.1 transporter [Pontibacter sp. 172403-2]
MENYSQVILYASIAAAALLIGGVLSIIRTPGAKLQGAILHFAAGVIFSVVAVELLPDIMAKHNTLEIVIGFGTGVLLMLAIQYFLEPKKEQEASGGFPIAFMVIIGIDLLIDGVLMGIGFATSQEAGVLLAVALSVELLSLGMATSTTLGSSGASRKIKILSILGLSVLVLDSALVSATLLSGISDAYLEVILSFGLAALLFLVTEELLIEAHENKQTPLLTAAFFAGFLLFMLLPGS